MILQRTSLNLRNIPTFNVTRMSSESMNVKQRKKDYEEGISLRAQRRKRAFVLYSKQHKDDKVWKTSADLERETSYYIENGLRKVYPYYYSFGSFIKGRWIGKTVMEVYKSEFYTSGVDPVKEFDNGNLTVNGKKVPVDFVLRNGMRMEHRCHRHEMPVLDVPIDIIDDTEELVVVNKPASIPVHPCGRYRYNSITMLLKYEYGYDNLRNLYRLDRLTSGVLIFPKTTSVSKKLEKQLQDKELQKEYVCRVVGKFPDGEVVCNEPLGSMSLSIALCKVDPNGKESSTTFTRLSYNGKTSVVKCVPHTGRTHQIRVHLQFLGHPICNDPLYNSPAFGPNRGKGGMLERTDQEIAQDIMKISNIGVWKIGDNPKYIEKFGNKIGKDSLVSSGVERTSSANQESEKTADSDKVIEEGQESNESCGKNIDNGSEQPCKRVKLDDGSAKCSDASETSDESSVKAECDVIETDEAKDDIKEVVSTVDDSDTSKNVQNDDSNIEKCDGTSSCSAVKEEGSDIAQVEMVGKVTDAQLVESKMTIDELCVECKYLYQEPKLEELIIYLHAVRYRGPSFDYSAPLPDWASEDFGDEHFT